MNMREMVKELERRRAEIAKLGGEEKVAKQHGRGKLTARERLARFFDGGAFFEIGIHGTQMNSDDRPPADAVVCGYGQVDGRMVCAAAYDFTVKGGSIGFTGETKVTRLRELALRNRIPMVGFVDSAGGARDSIAASGAAARWCLCSRAPAPCSARRSSCGGWCRWWLRWWGRARPVPPTSPGWPTSYPWSKTLDRWRWAARRWSRR